MGSIGIISIGKECKDLDEVHEFLFMINKDYDKANYQAEVPKEKINLKRIYLNYESEIYNFSVMTFGKSIKDRLRTDKSLWIGANLRHSWDVEEKFCEIDFKRLNKILETFKKVYNFDFKVILITDWI